MLFSFFRPTSFKRTNYVKVMEALEKINVESRPLWKPMHMQPLFKDSISIIDGTSENLFNKGLCLPSGSDMSDEDTLRVCDIIIKAL